MSLGHKHRHRNHDEFRNATIKRIMFGHYDLTDFFDEDELIAKMSGAKSRIVSVFVHECEFSRGKMRGTDNYVTGVGNKQSELARYVVDNMRGRLITKGELHSDMLYSVPAKQLDRLVRHLEYELVLLQLNAMCSKPLFHIYFDEWHGIWQMLQSVVDEYNEQRRVVHGEFRNRRSFHGKVRTQQLSRGIPPGASVGRAVPAVV